jgi:ectoine hydroxylase-related dioxygenase (phytanoyl-CoA dioxygenase family)
MKKEVKATMPNKAHEEIPGNPSVSPSSDQKLNDRSNRKSLRVLSEKDWKFWMHNGYIVIKNAIPKEQAKATANFIWEFDEKDPNDTSTWYAKPRAEMKMKELAGTGMVEAYNHQALWNNRQMQKVYDAFVDVWGTEKLWVTIDRVNLNFPQRPGEEKEGFIHWDYDPETRPQNVQGVIALADQMDESMGGFQCVPWLYRNYDTWKLTQPEDRHRFQPNLDSLQDKLVKVLMEAGDLLIFNSTEPHGIRPNRSGKKVRIAQYISMMPAEEENQELKDWRINSWKNRIAPVGYAFPGDPRNWEQVKYKTAELSKLGKKLLGLDNW